jgi:hypothetical protein
VDGHTIFTAFVRVSAMTDRGNRRRPAGMVVGSIVAITFGTVFVMVNSGGLAAPWSMLIRLVGVLVAAALVVGLVFVARSAPAATQAPASGFVDRRYWLIVLAEAVALFGGLAIINNVLHRSAVAVAWVALVVGVHFFGLARVWRMPHFSWLGAAITALGLAGFLIYALGGPATAVSLVAGVGSGAALYAAVAVALRDAVRGRASAAL